MPSPSPQDVTQLLLAWSQGEQTALEKLTPLVYKELHRLARRYMSRERPDHTLQTTALVNEAYLRLVDCSRVHWQNREGEAQKVSLEEALEVSRERSADLVALDDALNSLAAIDPRKGQVVE